MKINLPGISAIIPSFNDKSKVFRLLNSVKQSTYLNLEVIVVVNGLDDTLIEGREEYKWVCWIDAGRNNIGQTGCYNLGISLANTKNHILYIDSDVLVDEDMVTKLAERALSDKSIGIVTPMILYLEDKTFVNQAGAYIDLTTGKVTVGWGSKKNFEISKEVQNSGTALFIKREVVDKIGGFDDWFLCYFDTDFCLRAKKAGFLTWYEPKAVCFHDQSKDPNIWGPRVLTRAYLLGRNRVLFMRRHGNMLTFTICLTILLGYYLLESIRFGQLGKFFELFWGSIVGYFYPLRLGNYIPLPKVLKK